MPAPKKEIRAKFRSLQASFPSAQFDVWNATLGAHLLSVGQSFPPHTLVAVYASRPREASLAPLLALPLRFCFPLVTSESGEMEFHEVAEPLKPSSFRIGAFGIAEPAEAKPVKREELGAAFFPLLAFDAAGGRLGHGKGFYDRHFTGYRGRKLGVAFEWQRSKELLPMEAHDVRLDLVITETGLHQF